MRERLEAARASLRAAGVLPGPMVQFEYRDAGFPRQTIGTDPMSMVGAMVQQPLQSGGRRSAARELAAAQVERREAGIGALAAELTAAVRDQYGRLYAIDRERAVLGDAIQLADLLAATASSRYGAGESDQATVLRAQLERTRLGERLADLAAERRIALVTLNRLIDAPPDSPLGEVIRLPELKLPAGLTALPDLAAREAPGVAAVQADVEVAGREVRAAREELRPAYSIGGGLYWQGGTDRTVALTVGVEWPFRKEQRLLPRVTAAERARQAARLDLADASAEARAEAERLVTEVRRAEEQLERYRLGLVPQSSAAFDAARAGYLGGRGDFSGALDEFRRWTEIRVEVARREATRFIALGRLETLVGSVTQTPSGSRQPAGEAR